MALIKKEWLQHVAPPPQREGFGMPAVHSQPAEPFAYDAHEEDAFLQKLVWDEQAVAEGKAPERRANPRQFRRLEDRLYLQQMEEEAQQIRQQAQEAGYAAGYEQGWQAAQAEFASTQEQFWQLFESVQTARNEALASAEPYVMSLALQVAESILKIESSCDPTLVQQQIQLQLAKVERTQRQVVIHVHPSEAKGLRQNLAIFHEEGQKRDFFVQPNADVALGSCLLETNGGLIDASFHTQLQQLQKLLAPPKLEAPPESPPRTYEGNPDWDDIRQLAPDTHDYSPNEQATLDALFNLDDEDLL